MCYEDSFYRQQELAKKARKRAETRPAVERASTTVQPASPEPAPQRRKLEEVEVERELESA
jgi:hypothetical protein